MGVIENLAKRVTHSAVIAQKRQIAAQTYHVSLKLKDDGKPLSYTPGENLRILVGLNQPVKLTDMVRTYSVWNYDSSNRIIDIAVCTYSSGIGAAWAKQVKVGDTINFAGPKGKFTLDDSSETYILIGDISALAHLYELNRHISTQKKVFSIIYAERDEDFFADLNGSTPLSFHKLSNNPSRLLIERLEPILKSVQDKSIMYIGGDGRICADLNKYFKNRDGLKIKSKPFWYPGKTGLE